MILAFWSLFLSNNNICTTCPLGFVYFTAVIMAHYLLVGVCLFGSAVVSEQVGVCLFGTCVLSDQLLEHLNDLG